MDSRAYEQFTDQLLARLKSDSSVRGLIALGSMADASYRDEWSDHDFWGVTEPGFQEQYLDNLDWLPNHKNILLAVSHGKSYRTVLYSDRHKVEFAVFDPDEAAEAKIERFAVLMDRGEISELAQSVCARTLEERSTVLAWPHRLENLCALVWTGYCVHRRGELLEARRYIECYALDTFLNLIQHHQSDSAHPTTDRLDPRRRLERRSPKLARELMGILDHPVPAAGLELLRVVKRELAPLAPTLAWKQVDTVLSWLEKDIQDSAV